MNRLILEGAGWEKADSCGDVGNCRVRGCFYDSSNQKVYFECSSVEVSKFSLSSIKHYGLGNLVGFVTDCFYVKDQQSNYSKELSHITKQDFNWSKKSLLSLINSSFGTDFSDLVIDNEKYRVFPDYSVAA